MSCELSVNRGRRNGQSVFPSGDKSATRIYVNMTSKESKILYKLCLIHFVRIKYRRTT